MFPTPGLSHDLEDGADGMRSHMWGRAVPYVASVPEDEQPDESMVEALIGEMGRSHADDRGVAVSQSGNTEGGIIMRLMGHLGRKPWLGADGMTLAKVINACAAGEAKAAGTSEAMADNTERPEPANKKLIPAV
ncbi:hypothetical protein PIB30_014874 [Stylosanthes scabra]|uniref:Uncharacterized protein n=1 Tax=Stylosanthes scabra TaxID=79078 RepID=A0ABU6T843_9FABA|nr:hypothetical protein [Stylosanthes scabra]